MVWRFSPKITREKRERLKELWRFVQTKSARSLCVRVYSRLPYPTWSKADKRDYYLSEKYPNWEYYQLGYSGRFRYGGWWGGATIILRIGIKTSDKDIVKLMAHEWKHYLQYKAGQLVKGKWREPQAKRYAKRRVEKFEASI